MSGRDKAIGLIRQSAKDFTENRVQSYVNNIPADVNEGANFWCWNGYISPADQALIVRHDVSVAYELYRLLKEVTQPMIEVSGVEAPGEHNK